jgi:DNA polymerase-3 subunit epsilon
MSPVELEAAAAGLEASGAYRVLRRLAPRKLGPAPLPAGARLGIFLDLETTGLDHAADEIIELAMVRFAYGADGELLGVGDTFQSYREPSKPIPPEVTALTGIDDAKVKGQVLDLSAVEAFVAPAALIVAHNAGFDRRFAEKLGGWFSTKPWACSMAELPWGDEGFEGRALGYLAAQSGFFYEGHRAVYDCLAGVELLARPLPRSGRSALSVLLAKARKPSWRVWAENSPFAMKEQLKRRGYRWNGDGDGRPKAWWIEVGDEAVDDEVAWLRREIYGYEADVLKVRLTAFDRWSERA